MPSIETLTYTSQQLNIYLGITLFLLGILGCLWNILTFRHHLFRSSSCCRYMLIGSIASLIQLFFGLLIRILGSGFYLDWTFDSIPWCKIRNYITTCASLTALSCLVWTAMDRFFSTCRQIQWRYLTSVHTAKQICFLTVMFWALLCMPTLIYITHSEAKGVCASSSRIWTVLSLYFFNLFCYGIFPWFFMSLFGILTLKNLRTIHQQRVQPLSTIVVTRIARIDHQLTSMLFLQIIFSVISSLPSCIETFYQYLSQTMSKTAYRLAQEDLAQQVFRLTFYLNYISMFYVNYFSSPIFRRISREVVKNLFKKRLGTSRDVTIIHHQTSIKPQYQRNLNISTIILPHQTTGV